MPEMVKNEKLSFTIFDGIWRLRGRVRGSAAKTAKLMLLLSFDHIVDLIIREYHESDGHVFAVQVLKLLREEFWMLKVWLESKLT